MPLQPQALWIGYTFVHRIEAPVYAESEQMIEPLTSLILQAIALEQQLDANRAHGIGVAILQERLRLPAAIVHRVLLGMHDAGLLANNPLNEWRLTDLGQHALQSGHIPLRRCERRVFGFVENLDSAGQRVAAPMFLPIADCVGSPWQVETPYCFEAGFLRMCIAQSSEWKQTATFPGAIDAVADDATVDVAQQVLVDRPQRVMMLLIQTTQELLGFAVKVDGWTLNERDPVMRLPAAAQRNWPALAQEIPLAAWQDGWRNWCRQRQLPASEVDACTLTHRTPRLEVQAPPRLVQRLQAAKSDLFKGEAWLLVGDGFLRSAALLHLKAP